MKKLLPFILLTSLLLSACSIDWNGKKDKKIAEFEKQIENDIFKKKQDCLSQTEELKKVVKEVGKEYPSLGSFSFEQVFYSPKYNNCLWVRVSETEEKNIKINNINLSYTISHKNLYEIGNDSGTSEPINGCSKSNIYIDEGVNLYSCDEFDNKIKELKG